MGGKNSSSYIDQIIAAAQLAMEGSTQVLNDIMKADDAGGIVEFLGSDFEFKPDGTNPRLSVADSDITKTVPTIFKVLGGNNLIVQEYSTTGGAEWTGLNLLESTGAGGSVWIQAGVASQNSFMQIIDSIPFLELDGSVSSYLNLKGTTPDIRVDTLETLRIKSAGTDITRFEVKPNDYAQYIHNSTGAFTKLSPGVFRINNGSGDEAVLDHESMTFEGDPAYIYLADTAGADVYLGTDYVEIKGDSTQTPYFEINAIAGTSQKVYFSMKSTDSGDVLRSGIFEYDADIGAGGFNFKPDSTNSRVSITDKGLIHIGRASGPSTPVDGTIYHNTTDDKLYARLNGSWVDLTAVGTSVHSSLSNLTWSTAGHTIDATVDMVNNPIINIGAAGTDFTGTGGLSLADSLTVNSINSTAGNISITPVAGAHITLDTTVTVDAGVVAGITSLTSDAITLTNTITEFSTDGTMGDLSDDAIPTELAVTTYINNITTGSIYGLVCKYNTTTSITITSGRCWLPGLHTAQGTDATHAMTSLASGFDFHYIYINQSESTSTSIVFYDSTTEPNYLESAGIWHTGGDRCIGVVASPAGSATVAYFSGGDNSGNTICNRNARGEFPQMASSMNPSGEWQPPNLENGQDVTPVTATAIYLNLYNQDVGSNMGLYATTVEMAAIKTLINDGLIFHEGYNHIGITSSRMPLGPSRNISLGGSDLDENHLACYCVGYDYAR